jgi:hypothetical protein
MWGHRVDWLPHEYDGTGVFGDLYHYPNDIDRSLNETATDKWKNMTQTIRTIPLTLSPL